MGCIKFEGRNNTEIIYSERNTGIKEGEENPWRGRGGERGDEEGGEEKEN